METLILLFIVLPLALIAGVYVIAAVITVSVAALGILTLPFYPLVAGATKLKLNPWYCGLFFLAIITIGIIRS